MAKESKRLRYPSPTEASRFSNEPDHNWRLVSKLRSYYKEEVMCDVTLRAGDHSVKAHRLILAACSDYFEAMFSGDWKEAKNNNEIILHGLTPYGLKAVVKYCYEGDIYATDAETKDLNKIKEIITAFHHCQMVKACEIYEGEMYDMLAWGHIGIENCSWMYELAKRLDLKELSNNIIELLGDKVIPSPISFRRKKNVLHPVLFKIEHGLFTLLLDQWEYSEAGYGKVAVCDLIVKWVDHDKEGREKYLLELIAKIVGDGEDVGDLINYCRMTFEERRQLVEPSKNMEETGLTVKITNHGRVDPKKDDMMVVGFQYGSQSWKLVPQYPLNVKNAAFHGYGMDVLDNMLYIVGGTWNGRGLDVCRRYNPYLDKWEAIRSLPHGRYECPMVALDGKLYVVGGRNASNKLTNAVGIYDPETRKWSSGLPLPYPLYGHAIVAHNGAMYVGGGKRKDQGDDSKQFWRYTPGENTWMKLESMLDSYCRAGLVGFKDCLYLIPDRGSCPDAQFSYYNLSSNTWMKLDILPGKIYPSGAVTVGGSLYVWSVEEKEFNESGADLTGWDFFKIHELDHDTKTLSTYYEADTHLLALTRELTTLMTLKLPPCVMKYLPDHKLTNRPNWEQFQRERSVVTSAANQDAGGSSNP